MARQKSEFLSSFGTAYEIFKAVADEVKNLGGGDEELRRIISDRTVRRSVAELLVKNTHPAFPSYPLLVDYDLSVADAIRAGKYDWVNDNITQKNFPTTRTGKAEVAAVLVHFGKYMKSEQVLVEMDRMGLRAGELPELLALGERHPEFQREFPIVALGSSWVNPDGDRDVPALWRVTYGRDLVLRWFGLEWYGHYRFLAFSK